MKYRVQHRQVSDGVTSINGSIKYDNVIPAALCRHGNYNEMIQVVVI